MLLPVALQSSRMALTLRMMTNSPKRPSSGQQDPFGAPATLLMATLSELAEDLLPRARTAKAALQQMNGALHQASTRRA